MVVRMKRKLVIGSNNNTPRPYIIIRNNEPFGIFGITNLRNNEPSSFFTRLNTVHQSNETNFALRLEHECGFFRRDANTYSVTDYHVTWSFPL